MTFSVNAHARSPIDWTIEPGRGAVPHSSVGSDFFIDPGWLRSIRGGVFYYPAAGNDLEEPIAVLHDYIDTFWFCDIQRPSLKTDMLTKSPWEYRLLDRQTIGPLDAKIEFRRDDSGATYHHLEPSIISDTYKRNNDRQIRVFRRRGFGQIALAKEFSPRSISVFMHRGDSPGESGSNVYFLANKRATYPPCGNLFSALAERLADRSIIISDGSNSHFSWLRRFHRKSGISGEAAYTYHAGRPCQQFGGFNWACVGWLSQKYGPTLVWGLERLL